MACGRSGCCDCVDIHSSGMKNRALLAATSVVRWAQLLTFCLSDLGLIIASHLSSCLTGNSYYPPESVCSRIHAPPALAPAWPRNQKSIVLVVRSGACILRLIPLPLCARALGCTTPQLIATQHRSRLYSTHRIMIISRLHDQDRTRTSAAHLHAE